MIDKILSIFLSKKTRHLDKMNRIGQEILDLQTGALFDNWRDEIKRLDIDKSYKQFWYTIIDIYKKKILPSNNDTCTTYKTN